MSAYRDCGVRATLSSITIAANTYTYTSALPQLARQSAEDAATILINATKKTRTIIR